MSPDRVPKQEFAISLGSNSKKNSMNSLNKFEQGKELVGLFNMVDTTHAGFVSYLQFWLNQNIEHADCFTDHYLLVSQVTFYSPWLC